MEPKTDEAPGDRPQPEEVIAAVAKENWESLICVGITKEGDFQVMNSDMTAERALWIVEWARQWALGIDEDRHDFKQGGERA